MDCGFSRVFFGIFTTLDAWQARRKKGQVGNQASKASNYVHSARWVSPSLCPILVSPLVDFRRSSTFASPITYFQLLNYWLENENLTLLGTYSQRIFSFFQASLLMKTIWSVFKRRLKTPPNDYVQSACRNSDLRLFSFCTPRHTPSSRIPELTTI